MMKHGTSEVCVVVNASIQSWEQIVAESPEQRETAVRALRFMADAIENSMRQRVFSGQACCIAAIKQAADKLSRAGLRLVATPK